MRSWTKFQDRRDATLLFVDALDQDPELRAACKSNSETARETFQTIGDFDNIPADVVFSVFEEDGDERDKLVVILLPDHSKVADREENYNPMSCTPVRTSPRR